MEELFHLHSITRQRLHDFSQKFSAEQLNKIPAGFNNNIIWNLGHVVVTQQLLVYKLSGNQVKINEELIDKYRKGTKPEGEVAAAEISMIQDYLLSTSKQCAEDYHAGILKDYNPYMTSYGYEIKSVADALAFNNVHESMHLGTIIALDKSV